MSGIRRIIDTLSIVLMLASAAAIALMMVQIVADAAARNIFSSMVPGTTEIVSYYYMVSVTFLPLAYIQGLRGHVIIELFTTGLTPPARATIDGVVGLLCAAGMAYFAYAAAWKAELMTQAGEYVIGTVLVTTWPARWFVVSGTGLLSAMFLLHAIDDLMLAFGRRSVEEAMKIQLEESARLQRPINALLRKS